MGEISFYRRRLLWSNKAAMQTNIARLLFLALIILTTCCCFTQTEGPTVILGIVEDSPGHYSEDPNYSTVRVVFYRQGKTWNAFPSYCPDQKCLGYIASKYPLEVDWTIAFDGRELGHVTSRAPRSFEFYSTIGQQILEVTPPHVGKRSPEFGGFTESPVYRPLIAVSQPNYRDPEAWKPTNLSNRTIFGLRQQFRKRHPKVTNCSKNNIEKALPWSYSDGNISVVKGYASNLGWIVAELQLSEYECDGPADEAFSPQWFVVSPEQKVRALDSNMWLVDAGDYDNDGKSELVFSIDDYNRGGYKLFYDNFTQKAVFEFSYH